MGLSHAWHQFKHGAPGRRFVDEHDRVADRSHMARVAIIFLGSVLIGAGVVMLFIPGPGILAILFGLALIASGWRRLAAWLDLGEARMRAWRRER
jgi:uncharacterized membrane protein HdeD (DUF308 family)